jgi:putative ABC transport system permease protein
MVMGSMLTRKLRRDLWGRKLALLTIIAIIAVGIGCYVSFMGCYYNLDNSRRDYYRNYRLADFTINVKRAPAWSIEQVAAHKNISRVYGRIGAVVQVDLPGNPEPISGTAISLPSQRIPILNDVMLHLGGWFSPDRDDEVILNADFARAHNIVPGQRIKVLLLDKQHELLVVGTVYSPEFVCPIPPDGGIAPDPARYALLYCKLDFMRRTCDLEGAFNQILGKVHDYGKINNTLSKLEEELDPWGVAMTVPIEDQSSFAYLKYELEGIKASASIMPAIFLGVALLVLNVMISRMVAQQRTIIGTLKALGYSSNAVRLHYLAFGCVIGGIGGLIGCALGFWLQGALISMYKTFFSLPGVKPSVIPSLYMMGMSLSLGAAALGTLRGVSTAVKLKPAEAMRPAPPERGSKVFFEIWTFFWTRVSFRWRLILRSMLRNPFRSGVTVLASSFASAILMVSLTNIDALDFLVRYQFENIMHQDITTSLRDPKGIDAKFEIANIPAIADSEAQLNVVCNLTNGHRHERVGIIGLPLDSHLVTPLDAKGNTVRVQDSGIVLSRKLAQMLSLKVGDMVQLRPTIARREKVMTPVVAVVDTYLGLSAYVSQAYLSRLIGEEWAANSHLALLNTGLGNSSLFRSLREYPSVMGTSQRQRSIDMVDKNFGETMGTMMFIIILFAGLIAFGSVFNASLVLLSERERDVGTLRVLGYHPGEIASIFLRENAILNTIGILLGLLLGIWLTWLVSKAYDTELYRFPVVIRPIRFLHTAGIMAFFLVSAQYFASRMIYKMNWLEVLKVKE